MLFQKNMNGSEWGETDNVMILFDLKHKLHIWCLSIGKQFAIEESQRTTSLVSHDIRQRKECTNVYTSAE